ncbi:hypothetical protein C8A01DRAFT_46203 [Parachaetomium inaequale]|uniref:Protein kinase domain-containing protein n=1 Tax=Parachaetomium inaequale TaxID=2588326 RepID=A0AAN6PJW3_9PEZI|nr:hypothetical protein C8A01DRAFT_46203 [Parachaetomium inaequale]
MDGRFEEAEELRRQLRQAKRDRQEAEERAERAERHIEQEKVQRQKAREEAKEAKRVAEKERTQRQDAEPDIVGNRNACQEHLYDKFSAETNKALTSKGGLTDPAHKWCPTKLLPWSDFLDLQKTVLGEIYAAFGDERTFPAAKEVPAVAKVVRRRVANEADVLLVQYIAVQHPVSVIIEEVAARPSIKAELGISSRVVFENQITAISELADGADGRRDGEIAEDGQGSEDKDNEDDDEKNNEAMAPKIGPSCARARPDQVAVYWPDLKDPDNLEGRAIAFVVEYKAPHKLTVAHLRLGLREMDIRTEVVVPITSNPEHFQYDSERLVAAAVTQTYHYMIENGLEYSYLSTGEAFVFLKIDWSNPGNLFFHLAEPRAEVAAHGANGRHCTAVSQVLAFALLALRTGQKSQTIRNNATRDLKTWAVDYDLMIQTIAEEREGKSVTPSVYTPSPKTYTNVDRSPYVFLKNGRAALPKTCRPGADNCGRKRTPDGDDDDVTTDGSTNGPTIGTQTPVRSHGHGRGQKSGTAPARSSHGPPARSQSSPYCTQQCLLGLVCGFPLDSRCPNAAFHRRHGSSDSRHHPVDHKTWQRRLEEQLDQSLDDGIKPLWKQGARGVLFRVTLLEYGYTFVAKGTTPEAVEYLRREAKMYGRLRTLQGSGIPVFLGAVDLKWPYRYDIGVRLVHMLFLSWGGESILDRKEALGLDQAALDRQLLPLVQNMHRLGVIHMDVRGPNILWCEETGKIMLVDFERAITVASRRRNPHPLRAQAVQRFMQEDLGYAQIVLRT